MTERSPSPVFLDASVVMYAAGAEHPLREPSRRALERLVLDDVPLVTSSEVLQEILHRYFSLRRPDDAATVLQATRDLCVEVYAVTEADTVRALELLGENSGLSPRDAIHAAVAERNGVDRILTTDTDFDRLPGLRRLEPENV